MQKLRNLFIAGTLCLLGVAAQASGAATNGFMKVDGLVGDSEIKPHEGWIEILSYSFGRSYWDEKLEVPSAVDHGTGTRRGGKMLITREQSKAFDEFYRAASDADIIPEMTIEIYTDSKDPEEREHVITYTLRNVYVKMLRVDRDSRSRRANPIETMAIGFERVSWESTLREKTTRYPTHINRWH